MPINISPEVKDLINRMLQPNPLKRITMKEIKEHQWYRLDLPEYIEELSMMAYQKLHEDVDLDIVKKILNVSTRHHIYDFL